MGGPGTAQPYHECFNCGERGHFSKDCSKPKRDYDCYNCGESGHVSGDCPKPRKENGRNEKSGG